MHRSFLFVLAFALMSTQAGALTSEQWKADLSVLRQAIAAHPNPFRKITRDEFDHRADALAGELGQLNDSQVVARMAELVAPLADGHTRLTMPVAENAQLFGSHGKIEPPKIPPFGSLPIRLTRTVDGLVVTATTEAHHDLLGALVEAIDGKPIAEVESAIGPLVYGDNEHQREHLLPQFLVIPELLTAMNISSGEGGTVLWTLRLADGKQVSRRLIEIGNGPVSWSLLSKSSSSPGKRHWFTESPDGLIYARLTDILDDPQQSVEQFAESLFARVEATSNPTLVLDLRDNQGGDNTLNDSIVRMAIRAQKVWQPGRCFVLINGGTFSAAINLATLLERWVPVIFVGQPTGGSPNGYGDPKRTILPNSGLSLLVSTLYWQVSSPTDKRDCITPLLPVAPTAASLRNDQDLGLDLIRSLTKEPVSPKESFTGQWAVANRQLEISFQFATDSASLTIHALRIEAEPITDLKRNGPILEGKIAHGSQKVALHGRFTGAHFLGWLDIGGRPYSFVTKSPGN